MRDLLRERIHQLLTERQRRSVESIEQLIVGSIAGSVRTLNEDVAVVVSVRHGRLPSRDYTVGLLCDGMGGMAHGREAALIAASSFISFFLQMDRPDIPSECLNAALASAQSEVFQELRGKGGTTLSALFLNQTAEAWLIHVGDSRIYAIENKGTLRQLSRDDTMKAALNRESDDFIGSNHLIQFIGMESDLEPQLAPVSLRNCKGFLLTSDGAHGAPYDIMSTVARYAKSATDLIRKLLSIADALGGLDNATVLHVPSAAIIPEPFPYSNDYEEDDKLVTVLSTSGAHDIWMQSTNSRSTRRPQPGMRELAPINDLPPHDALTRKPKIRKKPRSTRSKSTAVPSDALSLDADTLVAKVEFMDD